MRLDFHYVWMGIAQYCWLPYDLYGFCMRPALLGTPALRAGSFFPAPLRASFIQNPYYMCRDSHCSVEQTLHHELIHVLQICRNGMPRGLNYCSKFNDAEFEAYYNANCITGTRCQRIVCGCERAVRSMSSVCMWGGRDEAYWIRRCMQKHGPDCTSGGGA